MIKKITALLLCFLLLCMCSVTALAEAPEDEIIKTVISVTVPDSHKITVTADTARVFYEGFSGGEFTVGRLSQPRLLVRAESGQVIRSVLLNGEDVTDRLHGGYLELGPVYEDKEITVTTQTAPTAPENAYTVRGKVTLNGKPLKGVELEMRPTFATAKTDENGNFVFTDVRPGEHSLTALAEGKVIGYLSFCLQQDSKADVVLLEDGTYTVSVDQNGAGVELHLVLNEETGTLTPEGVQTLQKAQAEDQGEGKHHCWLWWLLLILIATCIVVLETYRRKKKRDSQQ